jgi:ATP-binding protein involved in chromosome partitioning
MLMLEKDAIITALKAVKYPGYSRDIVSFGLVKEVGETGGVVRVVLQLTSSNLETGRQIKAECEKALGLLPGVQQVDVEIRQPGASGEPGGSMDPWAHQHRVPGLRHVVAVASGKGGVGKSTVAVNLACALARVGEQVGLLDCDIYGPTIPLMMGLNQRPDINAQDKLVPLINYDVKLMSIGFLVDDGQPIIWRGPLITKTIQQFLFMVDWGQLDCLLVDLPPGTGDAQLSLCQLVPLDGGLIVTTPQEASLGVVRKGIAMFEKVNVPILGLVENMSYFTAPSGERVEIFGHGGGQAEAARQNIPFLGEIPIFTEIRVGGDRGLPVVISAPKSAPSQAFLDLAGRFRHQLARRD